jgi:hypothetical protein
LREAFLALILFLLLLVLVFISLLTWWILRSILSLRRRRHLGSESAAEYTLFFLLGLFLLLATNGSAEHRRVLFRGTCLFFFRGNGTKSAYSVKLFILKSGIVGLRRGWTVSDSQCLRGGPAWAPMVAATATSDGTCEGSVMKRNHLAEFWIGQLLVSTVVKSTKNGLKVNCVSTIAI